MLGAIKAIRRLMRHPMVWAFIGLAVVAGLWYWWAVAGVEYFARLRHGSYGSLTAEELGQTGDLFGGVSAFFAALAFLGVGIGAYYQHRTWQISERQHVQQSFEPLFFQLVHLHQTIAREVDLLRLTVGLQAGFSGSVAALRQNVHLAWESIAQADLPTRRRILCSHYDPVYLQNEAQLGPYFRSLYHIFALIERSSMDAASKAQYASIARALLGVDTLFLLTINCLTERGAGMVPLVNKYGLLKHAELKKGDVPSALALIIEWFYEPTATQPYAERSKAAEKP